LEFRAIMADTKNYMEEELKDLRERFNRNMDNAVAHLDNIRAHNRTIRHDLDELEEGLKQILR